MSPKVIAFSAFCQLCEFLQDAHATTCYGQRIQVTTEGD